MIHHTDSRFLFLFFLVSFHTNDKWWIIPDVYVDVEKWRSTCKVVINEWMRKKKREWEDKKWIIILKLRRFLVGSLLASKYTRNAAAGFSIIWVSRKVAYSGLNGAGVRLARTLMCALGCRSYSLASLL